MNISRIMPRHFCAMSYRLFARFVCCFFFAGFKDVTNKRTLMHAFAEWCQRSHKDLLAVSDDFPDMEEVRRVLVREVVRGFVERIGLCKHI